MLILIWVFMVLIIDSSMIAMVFEKAIKVVKIWLILIYIPKLSKFIHFIIIIMAIVVVGSFVVMKLEFTIIKLTMELSKADR